MNFQAEFTRIKIGSDLKVQLCYQTIREDGKYDNHQFECPDFPLESFTQAMASLRKYALELAEYSTAEAVLQRTKVLAVSMKYHSDERIMSASITIEIALQHSPGTLTIKTPSKFTEKLNDYTASNMILPEECVNDLDLLHEEAQKYLNGERRVDEQIEMFEEASKDDTDMKIPEDM